MQLEDLIPGELRAAGSAGLRHGQIEDSRSGGQCRQERLLLGAGDRLDPVVVRDDLGIQRTHRVAHHRGDVTEHRLGDAEQARGAHGAAQQPAQDVAAGLIAGGHPVPDEHDTGAGVVGDHPEAYVVCRVRAVAPAGELLGQSDHRS